MEETVSEWEKRNDKIIWGDVDGTGLPMYDHSSKTSTT